MVMLPHSRTRGNAPGAAAGRPAPVVCHSLRCPRCDRAVELVPTAGPFSSFRCPAGCDMSVAALVADAAAGKAVRR